MTRSEVTAAITVTDAISRELDDDYVGLWTLPWLLRRALPDATDDSVKSLAESILTALLQTGMTLGDLDGETGDFLPWPEQGAVESVMAAWRELGRDPNIGEIAWLARTG